MLAPKKKQHLGHGCIHWKKLGKVTLIQPTSVKHVFYNKNISSVF